MKRSLSMAEIIVVRICLRMLLFQKKKYIFLISIIKRGMVGFFGYPLVRFPIIDSVGA